MIKRVLSKLRKVTMSLFAVLCAGAVWAEEGEVTYVTSPMQDPTAGYIRTGLGKKGNEVAVVFTNHTKTATWIVPANLRNVEFLVVGGGGGGGADTYANDAYSGGGGGGGGGVVTGLVSFVKNDTVSVTVGVGGNGGTGATKFTGTKQYGASGSGGQSMFTTTVGQSVTALGGGGSGGLTNGALYNTVQAGETGGSTAGGRAKRSAGRRCG